MRRLIDAPLSDFETVRVAAQARDRFFAEADYPPRCRRRSGRVTFRRLADGTLQLCVGVSGYDGEQPAIHELFTTGSLPFRDAAALHAYCHGPLAAAFAETSGEPAHRQSPPDHRALAALLGQSVSDQPLAAERLARFCSVALARKRPVQPALIILFGPSDLGEATMARALPAALSETGCAVGGLFEIDCAHLGTEARAAAIVGAPSRASYRATESPFAAALRQPQPIILLREPEKAHPLGLQSVMGGFADDGLFVGADGPRARCPQAIIVVTTSWNYEELAEQLSETAAIDQRTRERLCRAHLRELGPMAEIVNAAQAVAVFEPLEGEARRRSAERCIRSLASEFDLELDTVERALSETVVELAAHDELTLRSLRRSAWALLGEAFAAYSGSCEGALHLKAGPPPHLVGGAVQDDSQTTQAVQS